MKMNRDNFAQLLTPIHRKIFFDAYESKPEQYTQVCTVMDMKQKTESFPHMGAFGLWSSNTEGNVINEDEMHQGLTPTFEARRFDKGYSLTYELVKDDLYNVMQGMGKGGSAKALGNGLRATLETDLASVLNNGFTTNGYDGVPLFSNSHPLCDSSSLGDNLTTGALTDANLKAAHILMRDTRDEAGILIQAMANQLIVPPELEYTAKTILNSTLTAGELSNDTNTVPRTKLVVLDYLTSATAWFLRDSSIDNLVFLWREKPMFDSQKIAKTVDSFCYGYTRFDTGYLNYRGLIGSQG